MWCHVTCIWSNWYPKEVTLHHISLKCVIMWLVLCPIHNQVTSHHMIIWCNVTCVHNHVTLHHMWCGVLYPTRTQSRHIASHENVMQCDLYHIQLVHNHVTCDVICIVSNSYTITSHYITWQCDEMWLVSRPAPTVTSHYITCLNNISSLITSIEHNVGENDFTIIPITTITTITSVSDTHGCPLITRSVGSAMLWCPSIRYCYIPLSLITVNSLQSRRKTSLDNRDFQVNKINSFFFCAGVAVTSFIDVQSSLLLTRLLHQHVII
jgi:hypothetical protein